MAEVKGWTPAELAAFIKENCGTAVAEALEPLQKRVTDYGTWIDGQQKTAMFNDPAAQRTVEQKGNVVGGIIAAAAAQSFLSCTPLEWAQGKAKDRHGRPVKAQPAEVIKALEASTFTAGGVLIQEEVSSDFIDLLAPRSVVRSFGPAILPMDSGSMMIGKLNTSASAYYVGENRDMVKSQQAFGAKRLTAHKLVALVPVSNDLIRRGGPRVNTIVRNDTLRSVALKEDVTFLRAIGSQFTPRGLRYLAADANIVAATAGQALATVTTDLGRLVLLLEEGNVAMTNPGWVFAPRTKQFLLTLRDSNGNFAFREEMQTGKFWGWPYKTTTQIPRNLGSGSDSEVMLADFDDVAIGQVMNLDVAVSTEASYIDENGTLVSAFSLDQTVMRVITEHDIALRHDESVAVLTTVTWAP